MMQSAEATRNHASAEKSRMPPSIELLGDGQIPAGRRHTYHSANNRARGVIDTALASGVTDTDLILDCIEREVGVFVDWDGEKWVERDRKGSLHVVNERRRKSKVKNTLLLDCAIQDSSEIWGEGSTEADLAGLPGVGIDPPPDNEEEIRKLANFACITGQLLEGDDGAETMEGVTKMNGGLMIDVDHKKEIWAKHKQLSTDTDTDCFGVRSLKSHIEKRVNNAPSQQKRGSYPSQSSTCTCL